MAAIYACATFRVVQFYNYFQGLSPSDTAKAVAKLHVFFSLFGDVEGSSSSVIDFAVWMLTATLTIADLYNKINNDSPFNIIYLHIEQAVHTNSDSVVSRQPHLTEPLSWVTVWIRPRFRVPLQRVCVWGLRLHQKRTKDRYSINSPDEDRVLSSTSPIHSCVVQYNAKFATCKEKIISPRL